MPSFNVTLETEIPALLPARESMAPERFTFHSARRRMKHITKDELASLDAGSDRAALELSDAKVDVMGYACLVAIMSMGHGDHRASAERLTELVRGNGSTGAVVNSVGALIAGLQATGAKRVAVV